MKLNTKQATIIKTKQTSFAKLNSLALASVAIVSREWRPQVHKFKKSAISRLQ
jgi:hypothetical protein